MAETKNCKQCQQEFTVDDADLAFYNKISPTFAGKKYPIPSPTLCPRCRWQRRIVWRDEYILYRRKCDLSGRDMISRHHPDTSFPVYYTEEWQSDKWNPLDYGMDFDFNRPFFEQFGELVGKVPKPSVYSDVTTNQNSEYVNCAGFVKNCYMVVEADRNEDCLYSRGITDSKDCADCLRSNDSQFCYEGVDINKCYQCMYVQDLENCSECYFSSNLIGCKYCFGCDGLQQKQYYLFNEAVGKEKWEEFMGSVRYSPMQVEQYRRQLEEIRLKTPKRFAKIYKCENCQGDHLIHCKNTKFSFNSINQQDCRYCFEIQSDAKDAYDFSTFGLATSLVYECNSCGYNSYNLLFSNDTWSNMRDSFYCDNVQSSKSCFGCVGIRHQEFCILNKKYSKEQYEELVAKIIEHMQATGEWGEYFPMSISPFAYNETLAQDNFPLTKEEALALGATWRDNTQLIQYNGPFYEPKADIAEYQNSEENRQAVLNGVLKCQVTGKPFKIIPQELAFYLSWGLPIPTSCFEARHKARIARRNPMNLWKRQCDCADPSHNHGVDRCQNEFDTTYAPERPEKVYCEECYQRSVV